MDTPEKQGKSIMTGYDLISSPPKLKDEPTKNRFSGQSHEVCYEFGKWSVDKAGNMEYDKGKYYISRRRLQQDNWIIHLFQKRWIDWNEFMPAYLTACKINKIDSITIKIFYENKQ
jgi:hypothetical protein